MLLVYYFEAPTLRRRRPTIFKITNPFGSRRQAWGAGFRVLRWSYLLILLGLPGLYGAESTRMGRLGLAGFLFAFMGTTLIAVSGNFGFIAPVLAAESPETIDAISVYPPVVELTRFGGHPELGR